MQKCNVRYKKSVDGFQAGLVVENVVYDELVKKWAEMGILVVTEVRDDAPPAPVVEVPDEGAAPPVSARKSAWREFLEAEGVEFEASATKQQMIEAWEGSRGSGNHHDG